MSIDEAKHEAIGEAKHKVLDEQDYKSVDQLHDAVKQFSSNCFESKKMCATVFVSAFVFFVTLSKSLDVSAFTIGLIVILLFWGLDSYNYFYQEKLRVTMDKRFKDIKERHNIEIQEKGVGQPLGVRDPKTRWRRSLFNSSMWFYYILAVLDAVLLLAFLFGIIPPIKGK